MKILSIDGGGIKGLFGAAFLAGLEERFHKQIGDCFNLIAGTSTGGILALALAAHIPAQRIVDFYKEWGPKVFPQKFGLLRAVKSFVFAKYSTINLEKALKDIFKELKIKDICNEDNSVALCIPSINAITGTPCVFKTSHDPQLIRDKELFLWQIALATSAAPTYFPLAKIGLSTSSASNLFVDGGLWANNPSMVALTEALTYVKSRIEDAYLLSVGNIRSNTTFNSSTLLHKGVLLWRQKLVNLTLETQSFAIHNQIRLLFEGLNLSSQYVRVEQKTTSATHNRLKKLDCATKYNLNDLEIYGRERANHEGVKNYIKRLFREVV